MNIERMKLLRDVFVSTPEERINMNVWEFEPPENICGTVHCLAGLACTIPEFHKAGLRLTGTPLGGRIPSFGDRTGFFAFSKFFDIDLYSARRLCDPNFYGYTPDIKKSDVIKRLNEYINNPESAGNCYENYDSEVS